MSEAILDRPTQRAPKHAGLALTLISVAQLMVVLDGTIANIALPYIQSDLDIADENLSWIVTGYALAFGGLLLLGGRLADLFGRRRVFMIGVVVFALASALGGAAMNTEMLLGARALQGVGAAIAAPAALALITTTFPAGPQRNRAFSVYAAMSGLGAAVGLILGGWLTGLDANLFGASVEGWRLTFLINVPIGVLGAIFAPMVLMESEARDGELDLGGAILGTVGLTSLVYGFTRAGEDGWSDQLTTTALTLGAVLLTAFVVVERSVQHPLMPISILAHRTRGISLIIMALVPAAMMAMFFFLSQYVQNIMGYSPLKTGFAFLPFSFAIVVAAGISSKLMSKVDPRWLVGLGTALASAALFGLSRIPYDSDLPGLSAGATYTTDLLPFIIMMSLGMGFTFVPLTLTAVHGVSQDDSGIASGVLNAMQQVGGALGLSILATVATSAFTGTSDKIAAAMERLASAGTNPGLPEDPEATQALIGQVVYSDGATSAFFVGSMLILAAALLAIFFLNVRHEELATDGVEGVHLG